MALPQRFDTQRLIIDLAPLTDLVWLKVLVSTLQLRHHLLCQSAKDLPYMEDAAKNGGIDESQGQQDVILSIQLLTWHLWHICFHLKCWFLHFTLELRHHLLCLSAKGLPNGRWYR